MSDLQKGKDCRCVEDELVFEELVCDQPSENDDEKIELLASVKPSGVPIELAVHVFCRIYWETILKLFFSLFLQTLSAT